MELLLLNGVEVDILNKGGSTPLHAAANYGNSLKIFEKRNRNCSTWKILLFLGFADIVEFLIKNKARVNALGLNDNTPLHNAAKNGNVEILKI